MYFLTWNNLEPFLMAIMLMGFVAKEIITWIKEVAKKKKIQHNHIENLKNVKEIYPVLWQMLTKYVDRGWIFIMQHHNGGKFYSGKEINRMTITHEVKHPDLPSIKGEYQGVCTNEDFDHSTQLEKGEAYHANQLYVSSESVRNAMLSHNISCFFAITRKNSYGIPIATVIFASNKQVNAFHENTRGALRRSVNVLFERLQS